ncbi:MAG: response regulator [Saprospiraceae bacterium]|nr:response regulator [Saprospiraceae bacterium]
MQVIIIDDEWYGLDLMDKVLSGIGTSVVVAGKFQNPSDAIPFILSIEPDIIIMDVEMPYINGINLIKMFAHTKSYFILASAHDTHELEIKYHFARTEYLTKPYSVKEVETIIQRIQNKILTSDINQSL